MIHARLPHTLMALWLGAHCEREAGSFEERSVGVRTDLPSLAQKPKWHKHLEAARTEPEKSVGCLVCESIFVSEATPETVAEMLCICGIGPCIGEYDCGPCQAVDEHCDINIIPDNLERGSATYWKARSELLLSEILDELKVPKDEYLLAEHEILGAADGRDMWVNRWRVLYVLQESKT